MSRAKVLEITIKDVRWKIFSQSPSYYKKIHKMDANSYGITYPDDKEVFFPRRPVKISIVRHEVLHMLVTSSSTDRMVETTADDREEHIAQLLEDHYEDIGRWANEIHDFLMRCLHKER
jgi:hypothetical protein